GSQAMPWQGQSRISFKEPYLRRVTPPEGQTPYLLPKTMSEENSAFNPFAAETPALRLTNPPKSRTIKENPK
ncbi:MAG: hypothetical protein LUC87_03925, partial [Clostridiales bacterium]|nr:hypothetical protein [Clostridiales bacterium]